jgi:dienelactone hydrolase
VSHRVALWDAPLRIAVSGLKPSEHAVLRATSSDVKGKRYVSATALTANSLGRVELTGPAAMRPLWSLRPMGLRAGTDFDYFAPPSGAVIRLEINGATTTIRRITVAGGVHGVSIRHPFYGEYYAPTSATPRRPGIVVFGGSEGGLSTTGIAKLYASHGYPSLALAYFGEPGLPRNLVRIPLEYFASALRWLQQQPGVDPTRLVAEGISRGSEAAQLLGIHYPRLVHAVIAMVPAVGSECGIRSGSVRCAGPAWSFHGKPIPWGEGPYNPFPFQDQRIDGPVFLDCAGADQLWPSCPMAQAIVHRLHANYFRHRVIFLDYPEAGHGVGSLYPNLAYSNRQLGGVKPDSNDEAAADGWPKLLQFMGSLAGD